MYLYFLLTLDFKFQQKLTIDKMVIIALIMYIELAIANILKTEHYIPNEQIN